MSNNHTLLDKITGRADLIDKLDEVEKALEFSQETNKAELEALQGAIQYLVEEAYWEGPMSITPDNMLSRLGELDSQLIDDLINQRQWDVLGTVGGAYFGDLEYARKYAIDQSRYMYIYNPLVKWMIGVWTNYGLGDSVEVAVNNTDGDEVFQEFWNADRNANTLGDDNLQYLSIFTLQDGNTFLACFSSKADGLTTVEEIPVDEIVEIITNPERKSEKLFYKRVYSNADGGSETIYYPDWMAKFSGKLTDELVRKVLPENAKRADERNFDSELLNDIETNMGTDVVVLHIAHNRMVRNSAFGWPLLSSPAYVKAHKRFMENRMTVADAKAMFVRRKQVTGGSRAIDSVRQTINSRLSQTNYTDTNPPATAGSVELDNQAIKTTDLPMTTGASDAKIDHEMFSWMALLSGGTFPTTAGLDTSRWATALAMDKTLAMQWSRYQTFWATQFENLVKIVLKFAELYGGMTFVNDEGNQDYTANVNIDTLSLVDFPDIVDALSKAVQYMLQPYLENGVISEETAQEILRELWLIMLQALGLSSSQTIASKEAFGIIEESSLPPEIRSLMRKVKQKIKDQDFDFSEFGDEA